METIKRSTLELDLRTFTEFSRIHTPRAQIEEVKKSLSSNKSVTSLVQQQIRNLCHGFNAWENNQFFFLFDNRLPSLIREDLQTQTQGGLKYKGTKFEKFSKYPFKIYMLSVDSNSLQFKFLLIQFFFRIFKSQGQDFNANSNSVQIRIFVNQNFSWGISQGIRTVENRLYINFD
eukprot:TRINITY_DN4900_c0_g1_i5.p3 TRINITY_DN4900_c0_g1~~TRINITY_DN4900_c0_g1_i5.p3  ORF type:complete len:175 (-),score=2.79 TRINITY_DN4900_c0_g1_i5:1020-1544(-)